MLVLGIGVLLHSLMGQSLPVEQTAYAQRIAMIDPTPTSLPEVLYAELDARDQAIINLYERVSPSVVHIITRTQTRSFFYGIISQEGTGSGFVFDTAGHIVTNLN